MPNLLDFYTMPIIEKRKWEVVHSSLARVKNATYDQCRDYSCQSVSNGLTEISVKKGDIVEIPRGIPFHFIGRVDTSNDKNSPESYYKSYMDRHFISYTTICNKNVSHYKGDIFFIYNLYSEDIVHIFPMDSDISTEAGREEDLTKLPSLWITLPELEALSEEIGVYNQITARTKRAGKIIRPCAVAAFEQTSNKIQKVADSFGIGTLILHPDSNAINYTGDVLSDWFKLKSISEIIEKKYGFSVCSMYYAD